MDPSRPTLSELQDAVCRSLLHRADDAAHAYVITDGLDAGERLDIYRNTATGAMLRALRLSYPAVQHLAGAEFFEGAARMFINENPPQAACLDYYGGSFPAFLAWLPQAAPLAYLADVARFEWLVNTVLHAPDAKPLALSRLAQMDEAELGRVRFEPHPAARLFRSDFPVDSIWRSVLERDDDAMAAIDLASGPVWLLVRRSEDGGVDVRRCDERQWQFTAALFARHSLQRALEEAPCGDPQLVLAAHLAQGCFIGACV